MKLSVIAAVLLVSTVPVLAAKQPPAKQWPIIREYGKAATTCIHGYPDDGDRTSEEVVKVCGEADRLGKKLEAQGFCLYAISGVGYPSKDRKHCYAIHYPPLNNATATSSGRKPRT